MRGRMLALVMTALMIGAPLLSGCTSPNENDLRCGDGTTQVGDECVGYNDVSFTLRAENMAFIGVGGAIDGISNPVIISE